jgi:hypothetical protein
MLKYVHEATLHLIFEDGGSIIDPLIHFHNKLFGENNVANIFLKPIKLKKL